VREHPSWDHVRATITRVGGRPLRLLATTALDKLGFDDDERAAAECLRMKPSTIPELAIVGGLTIQSTDLLAYFLVIAKQVELTDRTGTSVPPQATPSAAPARPTSAPRVATPGVAFASGEYKRKISFSMSAVSPESGNVRIPSPLPPERVPSPMPGRVSSHPGRKHSPMPGRLSSPLPPRVPSTPPTGSVPPGTPGSVVPPPSTRSGASQPPASSSIPPSADLARKKSIVDRAKWIDQEDFFKMLTVGRDATTEDVRAAFLRAAKVWHPDTLPLSIIDVRPDCEKVFTRINTERRRVYEHGLNARMKDDAQAEQLMSQAEMHVTLGDRLQAEGLVRKALVASPEFPDAMALLAYLESLDPRKSQGEQLRNCLRLVDMAIGKDPMCKKAHFYRAQFKKRLEDHEGAIRDLRIAVTNDPDDVDAQRELKVYEQKLREGTIQIRSFSPPGGVKKSEGFFERLRKK
jgi:hypothetical protein